MKGKKVTALVMLLALAVACFISATAFTGEHPWDSEGNNGGGSGSSGGGIIGGGLIPVDPADSTSSALKAAAARPPMEVWTGLVFQISYYSVKLLYGTSGNVGRLKACDRSRTGSR